MSSNSRKGYRGYIFSRPFKGGRAPQHIQQLVIRDYCQKNNMHFLLSVVEYKMPGCSMMLEQVIDELSDIEGMVVYSILTLPVKKEVRQKLYNKILSTGKTLHAAVENMVIKTKEDIDRLEDIFMVYDIINGQNNNIMEKVSA